MRTLNWSTTLEVIGIKLKQGSWSRWGGGGGATFFPCKQDVQDDVTWTTQETIVSAIFGSETKKQKGLIDSVLKDYFLGKVDVPS